MVAIASEQFRAALARAGISDDKPLHPILTTIYETATEAREAVKGGARGLSPEGERALIDRVAEAASEATYREIDPLALRVGWRNALLMALAGLGLLGAGYLWRYLRQPEPGFLGQLAAYNDVPAIERFCQAHTVQQDGGTACSLGTVWVKRPH